VYGLRTLCFRQSCIYGPHQFGNEDQGWVAWFAIRALLEQPVTIYGDGKQVRDVLYVDDLGDAYDAAVAAIDRTSGQAFNLGGGPDNTLSLLDLLQRLDSEFGLPVEYNFSEWRPGDQRVYISDIGKAWKTFRWRPRTAPSDGLAHLIGWLRSNQEFFHGAAEAARARKRRA
jgi:CDP-paratose 2-epimerase